MKSRQISIKSLIATVVAPVAFVVSCGQPTQKVDLKNDLLDASGDSNCKAGNCPAVEYSLVDGSGKSIDAGTQTGSVGKEFSWTVKVKSTASSSRIKIAIVQRAQWMNVKSSASDGGGFDITGNPTEAVSQNSVIFLARDIGRCAALEKTSSDCQDSKKSFTEYDKKFEMKYSISGGSSGVTPSNVTPSNTTPSNSVTPSNNSSSSPLCSGFIGIITKIIPVGGSLGCK